MTIPPRPRAVKPGLSFGHSLVDLGVPVFTARLDKDGSPHRLGWEKVTPSHREVDAWRPGKALCVHTGVLFDGLDVDPRHGGDVSYRRLRAELGGDPEMYAKVRTRSGGLHLYVPPLGLGTHHPIPGYPGIDLQGRGAMLFIPPTVRLGGRYELRGSIISELKGASRQEALAELVRTALEAESDEDSGGGRHSTSELWVAVLAAEDGGQRKALLRWVDELEKRYERDDAIEYILAKRHLIPVYDKSNPWRESDLLKMLHKPGEIIPDGREADGLEEPNRPSGMQSFAEIRRRKISWLWPGYLARGEFTVLDGAKGCGKSLVMEDIAARLSRGDAMPGEETGTGEVVDTAIFTTESHAESEVGPRLDAAGAVPGRVWTRKIERDERGKAADLLLPRAGREFGRKISAVSAGLAVWDPINDFLDETISTNNDASIRRAIGPLGPAIRDNDCAGILVRHLNKNTGAPAAMRGAGTTAYQNRARVHLICGRLPEDAVTGARFGLAVIDSNLRRVEKGILAYDIVDSDIEADDSGGYVARVVWHGRIPGDADSLVRGDGARRRGPDPYVEREAVAVVRALFRGTDTVPSSEVESALDAAGISYDSDLMGRVKKAVGARSVKRKGGPGWDWTVGKFTLRRRG